VYHVVSLTDEGITMHRVTAFMLFLFVVPGCQQNQTPPDPRTPITLNELAITVRDVPRSYMLSDKSGAFLVGTVNRASNRRGERWTVGGESLLAALRVTLSGVQLTDASLDSARVLPDRVEKFYSDGYTETISILEGLSARGPETHAFVLEVKTPVAKDIALGITPSSGRRVSRSDSIPVLIWERVAGTGTLALFAGTPALPADSGLLVRSAGQARFILLYSLAAPGSELSVETVVSEADSLLGRRAARMEALLDASYIRTSDPELSKALCWFKLSLDALIIQAKDTFAVSGIPWDGALYGRDNAQSIAGIGLATGDFAATRSIIRSLGRWQESSPARADYGRIPDRVLHGAASYDGADIGPWFVREMYEHITYANDTALVRELYPLVKRGIEGTLKYHRDWNNLLVHGDAETWMSAKIPGTHRTVFVPRGNRASEIQLLWYFQQLIGSFLAAYVGDAANETRWAELAKETSASFNDFFVDTVRNIVYDHIAADGKAGTDVRPNPMFCLEIINSEAIQQSMIKTLINSMVYRHGFGTLDHRDLHFRPYSGNDESMFNGPVWTWLAGQLAYTLSRYDRQDFSYQIMEQMVHHAMTKGMVGTLPAMMDVLPRPGTTEPQAAGADASLTGMAEFVRAFYQDYLGLHIDAPSNQISIQPKLPPQINDVDFTVTLGTHPINGKIERRKETSRIILSAPDITRELKVGFLWMLDNGDAWRGSTTLAPNAILTIAIGTDDVVAYEGDNRIAMIGQRKLRQFSQRTSFSGFDFVDPSKP
jgi:glycogen debranching enzyme